jgi:hypothetical protein
MITNTVLQWVLSSTFVIITAYSLFWVVRSRTSRDRISYLTHVLMGAAMCSMIWPWGMALVIVPQIVVFSLAALWFLSLAWHDRHNPKALGAPRGHHDGSGKLAYHAGMMAGMVGMGFAMLGYGTASGSMGVTAANSVPGMDMSGTMDMSGVASGFWVSVLGVIFALGFAVAALFFVGSTLAAATTVDARTSPGRLRLADGGWNFLMAAGMLALFVPLISFG